jgi:hypothetical protein
MLIIIKFNMIFFIIYLKYISLKKYFIHNLLIQIT